MTNRDQLNAELLEVCELITEWAHEMPPEGPEFWQEWDSCVRSFREAFPEDAEYAMGRLAEILASAGLERPSGF